MLIKAMKVSRRLVPHAVGEMVQSIWSKRRQGFQPCFEAGVRELPILVSTWLMKMMSDKESTDFKLFSSCAFILSPLTMARLIILLCSLTQFCWH